LTHNGNKTTAGAGHSKKYVNKEKITCVTCDAKFWKW